jgi:type II secretion system protein J
MSARLRDARRRGSAGFTLIEVLAATAMFAVLVGALYPVFHTAMRMREKAADVMEETLPRHYVAEVMKRDLRQVVAPVGILAGAFVGKKEEDGTCRRDRLEFHTASGAVDSKEPWGDVQRVAYYLAESLVSVSGNKATGNTEAYELVRAVTRNLLASTEEDPKEERLLKGVRSLAFSYYDGEAWQDSWDSTTLENETPVAVRARIEFAAASANGPATFPIEMVVPIAAKAPTTEEES